MRCFGALHQLCSSQRPMQQCFHAPSPVRASLQETSWSEKTSHGLSTDPTQAWCHSAFSIIIILSLTKIKQAGLVLLGVSQFSRSDMSDSLWPCGPQHARPPCSSPIPWVYSNSCPLSQWCYPTISSSAAPFSFCLQFFTASVFFPMSWLYTSGGQSIEASALASVLPMNIEGWFLLRLTYLISLLSKRLSESSPAPQFKSINSSALSLYGPTLTSIHDYWKSHSFDLMDLCGKSDVLLF